MLLPLWPALVEHTDEAACCVEVVASVGNIVTAEADVTTRYELAAAAQTDVELDASVTTTVALDAASAVQVDITHSPATTYQIEIEAC